MNSANGLHPERLTMNVAVLLPLAAMSPNEIGKVPGAVTLGEQEGPQTWVNVKPLIWVA